MSESSPAYAPEAKGRAAGDAAARRGPPIGTDLVARGLISEDQLTIALTEQNKLADQRRPADQLGAILVKLGFISESVLKEVLAETFGKRPVQLSRIIPSEAALALVPKDEAKKLIVFPVSLDPTRNVVQIAMEDPADVRRLDKLASLVGRHHQIETCLAARSEILLAIDQHYEHVLSIDGVLREIETGRADPALRLGDPDRNDGPVPRLVNAILSDAIQRRASDIHFEPEQGFVRIRYRIDGVLRQVRSLHAQFWDQMVVRLKLMADMKIDEKRKPQDGHTQLLLNARRVDFRVASQPTIHGENFVLRILDRDAALMNLEEMGLSQEQVQIFNLMLARPEGLILVTGPTGSGKTTTLYSLLNRLNDESVNVMTLEDPIEYQLPLIRQTNLAGDAIKLDFASGVRSLMRQDPDIILIGEIRDAETATMAAQAAMTGHKVLSTLHTNSAVATFVRLRELQVTPTMLSAVLGGVVAQRLARKLCVRCRISATADHPHARFMGKLGMRTDRIHYANPEGCPACDRQGYRGRIPILEMLTIDARMEELIASDPTPAAIFELARKQGFRTLAEDALSRVEAGVTSIKEITRIIDLTRISQTVRAPATARPDDAPARA